jgi:hypothetical protein
MINELLITIEDAEDTHKNCWCRGCREYYFYDGAMCKNLRAVIEYGDLFVEGAWIHSPTFWRKCKYYRRDGR